eukprot:CAMPEP_0116834976 /NCGR_PEP_ID=MMETSP0418-20121206/7286_1 /TAXON_ID=1158023 /ORGANISM="Astrosyne radiata, Strain 13vi08-1A" /LENGTH=295 /DNA_ID=CAMNT_0004464587 /DNA_START=477 /DNA_END=1364 /DNA_ORIENTATION=-
MRQHQNFFSIREAGGKEMTNDLYIQQPGTQTFWFIGKVARISDITVEQAVVRQWNIIEHHALNLRALELFAHKGELDIWYAPGDSELDVAYNKRSLPFKKVPCEAQNVEAWARGINAMSCGFQGEMYEQDGLEFKTLRTDEGKPIKPEIDDKGAKPQDVEKLFNTIEGMDVEKLYREQERRAGREVEDEVNAALGTTADYDASTGKIKMKKPMKKANIDASSNVETIGKEEMEYERKKLANELYREQQAKELIENAIEKDFDKRQVRTEREIKKILSVAENAARNEIEVGDDEWQ